MTELVAHRGPDGWGTTYLDARGNSTQSDANWNVALGHRRLSILDLSEAGRQPMAYGGRFWISYNGEIYNYVELRKELSQRGHRFQTGTDTEVLLAAYDEWGEDCFARLRGMWGLVLVDVEKRKVVLSRDRLGIKPLYFSTSSSGLYVSSEIKQLKAAMNLAANDAVVLDYLATGYEAIDETFFAGVSPVPAGHYLRVDLETLNIEAPQSYWDPSHIEADIGSLEEAASMFREHLLESTRIHLRSDVPVGCALSGGLDSSTLAACVNALAPAHARLHTFSVTFPGHPLDESDYIHAMVRSIRANPHYVTPNADDVLKEFDRFVYMHDEPVGSLSQYAAYAIARITREAGVPVTLNGQGGDEVLSGYWQHYFAHLAGQLKRGHALDVAVDLLGSSLAMGNRELLWQAPSLARRVMSRLRPEKVIRVNGEVRAKNRVGHIINLSPQARRVYEIRELTLPRLLKWDDRNFMAFSVEGRYPLLDHKLIELCLRFSPQVLYRNGWTKNPLRWGFEDLLPPSIVHRRSKIGFETPQKTWLHTGLRENIEGMLANSAAPVWAYVDQREGQVRLLGCL